MRRELDELAPIGKPGATASATFRVKLEDGTCWVLPAGKVIEEELAGLPDEPTEPPPPDEPTIYALTCEGVPLMLDSDYLTLEVANGYYGLT